MNKLEGIFVYDIDSLQAVAASHLAERSRVAQDAESLIAAEVDRFLERQRAVSAAPAIVALQRQAEDMRQAELRRMSARLASLTAEQAAAVEALTRGLVNKFLHQPMQALKQAARENDSSRLEALCDTWSLPAVHESARTADQEPDMKPEQGIGAPGQPDSGSTQHSQAQEKDAVPQ
jgi:glutamyl-tRNA reductase